MATQKIETLMDIMQLLNGQLKSMYDVGDFTKVAQDKQIPLILTNQNVIMAALLVMAKHQALELHEKAKIITSSTMPK